MQNETLSGELVRSDVGLMSLARSPSAARFNVVIVLVVISYDARRLSDAPQRIAQYVGRNAVNSDVGGGGRTDGRYVKTVKEKEQKIRIVCRMVRHIKS
jgi:hypothetical protein